VNGYDPKEGMKAAGYPNVTPAAYGAGVPYGTPGSVAGVMRSTDEKGSAASAAATPPAALTERRRARYDCAVCHY
jgi:hypothetical protein